MEDSNITRLEYDGKEILLVGTAHVSKESAELVKSVIEEEKPDSVCVELDEKRYENIKNPQAWEKTDIVQVIKSHKVGFMIANLALSSYQKKIAKQLDAPVGGEMIQGMKSAAETGAELVLADRDIQTTFLRIWRKLGLKEKTNLLYSLLLSSDEEGDDDELSEEDLKKLLERDMLESVMSELKEEFPKIGEILIHERDQYLASKIRQAPGKKVVAVLGGAHVPGVKEEIYKKQDLSEISTVPPKSSFSKMAVWILPVLLVGLFVIGFFINPQKGWEQISVWLLWTSSLAAIFTALALAHPLSILTSFLAAPAAALHPFLACGWFSGLVEAHMRKPTVQDVHNIQDDIFSLKGWFLKNRFLKILLVVTFANIGASIANITALVNLIRNVLA